MRKLKKILIIVSLIALGLFSIGYFGLQYLQNQLEQKLTGCKIESKGFYVSLPFEYVNNWMLVDVGVNDDGREFPFIFDTGAQTVLLDSLLNITGKEDYQRFKFSNNHDTTTNAFNNELVSIHHFKIGEINFADVGAITAQNAKWGMLNCISPYGIIGYNVIQTFFTQINYATKQIVITDDLKRFPNYSDIQWVDYEPSQKQETPIIQAVINDSIQVRLLFDTGHSGGIVLHSNTLYHQISSSYAHDWRKYVSMPSLQIRGEGNDLIESVLFRTSEFTLGSIVAEGLPIQVKNLPEGEFTGFVGNKFLENFIVTLDYKNKRIGFIQQQTIASGSDSTFGFTYLAKVDGMEVLSVFENTDAARLGFMPGDKIYSINGINVAEVDNLCSVYRGEITFQNPSDTILSVSLEKNGGVVNHLLKKQVRFD